MWKLNCLVIFCMATGRGSGSGITHTQDALAEFKRELRNELFAEIREAVRSEVQAQLKDAIKDELQTTLHEAANEYYKDIRGENYEEENAIVTLVKEVVKTEMAAGIHDIILEELHQTLPKVVPSLSVDWNATRKSKHHPDQSQRKLPQSGLQEKRHRSAADAVFNLKPRATRSYNVAFAMYLDHILDHVPGLTVLKFNQAQLNENNAYNVHSGVFTVSVEGVYLFHFEFIGWTRATELRLVVDNVIAATAIAVHQGADNYLVKAGTTTLVHVNAGQAVWVETFAKEDGNIIASSTDKSTGFIGILMY